MQIKTVLITILAVLSAVLVGVSAYQRSNQSEITPVVVNQPPVNQPVVNQPVVNQPVVNQPAATTSDETAGWKTYRNEQFGVEMKYPSMVLKLMEFQGFSTSTASGNNGKIAMVSLSVEGNLLINKNNPFSLLIGRNETIDCNNDSTWVQTQSTEVSTSLPIEKVLTVDGYSAKYLEKTEALKPNEVKVFGFDYQKSIFICVDSNPDVSFFAQLVSDKNESYYSGIFDRMLSTFKFVK